MDFTQLSSFVATTTTTTNRSNKRKHFAYFNSSSFAQTAATKLPVYLSANEKVKSKKFSLKIAEARKKRPTKPQARRVDAHSRS